MISHEDSEAQGNSEMAYCVTSLTGSQVTQRLGQSPNVVTDKDMGE